MNTVAWRIVHRRFAKIAFTGEGARLFGGRWNSPGRPVIYTAQSQALAALEILVHLDSEKLLRHYVALPVTQPNALPSAEQIRRLNANEASDHLCQHQQNQGRTRGRAQGRLVSLRLRDVRLRYRRAVWA